MRSIRKLIRLYDFQSYVIAEELCQRVSQLFADFQPLTVQSFQERLVWLLSQTDREKRQLLARAKAWESGLRRIKRNQVAARIRMAHQEQVDRAKVAINERSNIIRQAGDAVAWLTLEQEPRFISPLFSATRSHQLSNDAGLAGPLAVMQVAHNSERFLVVNADLTRCLGIGDLIVVPYGRDWEWPIALEVKTHGSGRPDAHCSLVGAAMGTPVDETILRAFAETISCQLTDPPELRPRERRQAEEIMQQTRELRRLHSHVGEVVEQSAEMHWPLIKKVIDKARVKGSHFVIAEDGLAYAAVRNRPGDNINAHSQAVAASAKHALRAGRRQFNLTGTMELRGEERLSPFALPIALWDLPVLHRAELLHGLVEVLCFYDPQIWKDALARHGIRLKEDAGWWMLSKGNAFLPIDPPEVSKHKVGVAFSAISPKAAARRWATELSKRQRHR